MATAMLPGLGGGTGGVQLQPGQLANSTTAPMAAQNAAAATASGSIAVPTTAPLLSAPGAVQPSKTAPLPLPTINPNANFNNTMGGVAGTPVGSTGWSQYGYPGNPNNTSLAAFNAYNNAQPNVKGGVGPTNVVPGTSMPASNTPPPANLPTPQVTPAPALQLGANGALPQGLTPMTPTQILNTPQMNTPAEFAAKFGAAAATPNVIADTATKYNELYKSPPSTTPTNKGEANTAITKATDAAVTDSSGTNTDNKNPIGSALDAYASMSPVVKSMYDNIQALFSSRATRTSLVDEFTKLNADQGIQADKLALMNINNVMNGTEDDIRNEISKTGGFATNSQVMALTAARNKVLMNQASALQDTITAKEDYVKEIMTLTQADFAEADKQVSEQIGLDEKVAELQISLDNAATSNLQSIVSNIGYAGLAQSFQGNPQGMAQAEQMLGLPKGALLNPAFLASTNSKTDFTLSPGSSRYDAQGNLIASQPTAASQGGGGAPGSGSADPYVQSWVTSVLNGNATMQQVPANLRNEVALSMANAPQAAYGPLAASRFSMASNRIVSNFIKLPQYELTANGLPYLQRIDAAMKTPGSVSDQDLLDSLTKLNTSGNAITDAQVKIITGGRSFSDFASVMANKFQTGGVLSQDQRQQIQTIAQAIFSNYSKGYQPVYDQAASQLQAAGIPKAFWTIPDLNNLSGYSQYTQTGDQLPGLGAPSALPAPQFPTSLLMTDFQEANGVMYAKGNDGTYYPL